MPESLIQYVAWALPFGILGIISWGLWGTRKFLSAITRPTVNNFRTTATIVVPSYHEDPDVLIRCLGTWLRQNPSRIIIVLDVADVEAQRRIEALGHSNVDVQMFQHRGKRSALGHGIRLCDTELIILIDSDTAWEDDMYEHIQMPFIDPALNEHLVGPDGPVAAVQHLLADLAVRSWTEPVIPRQTVITISDPSALDAHLLDVLLGGLEEAPFVDLAPLPVLFSSIAPLDPDTIPLKTLWPEPVASAAAKIRDRGLVEITIEAYQSLVGGRRPEIAHLDDLLEATAAAELDTGQGEPYLRAVYDAVLVVLDAFEAPDDQNVRLTSRRATVPFTVDNGLSVPVHVRMHLESDGRLDFPDGDTLDATLTVTQRDELL